MRTKIYTKGGDLGETSLIGGQRVSKSHPQLDAYGTVDELNAAIGVCMSQIHSKTELLNNMYSTLETTQNQLFNIGSHLACADEKMMSHLPKISETYVGHLENQIDEMTAALPELRDFILPGGHPLSASLHMARTICRRAERLSLHFFNTQDKKEHPLEKNIIICLNRLSDYLFVAARFANHAHKVDEVKWKK